MFSLNAAAGEVTEFKPRPAAVETGTDIYVGILLSEEDIKKDNTWFRRNKGTLGLLSGLVIGVGTSIAIVKAVYQGQ